ncbi:uncharacterized protein N7483_004721 [Penicillium malachiteum]|uniref:uncharacterized protein n=1 Tax=Penicillium malachiteum TaxID=1324776 RepID=UPI002547E79E|nr:uncharacterized protein N7483_004721 [Penicillium malachiteum]KAJ5730213.1 hypothetical protein N7483_004721 [Penicillium malachiteum]
MYTRRGPPKRKVSPRLRHFIDTHPSQSPSRTDSTFPSTYTEISSRSTRRDSPRSTSRHRVRSPLPFRPRREPGSGRPDTPASRSREWILSWFRSPSQYTRDNGRRRENQSHVPSQPQHRTPDVDSQRRSRSDRANRPGPSGDHSPPRVSREGVRERETEIRRPRYHTSRLSGETPRAPRIHTNRPELRNQQHESSRAPRRTREASVFSDRRPQRRGRRLSPVRDDSTRQPSSTRTNRPLSDDTPPSSVYTDIPMPAPPVRPGTPMPRTETGRREHASQRRVVFRSPQRRSQPTVILRRPSGTEPDPDVIIREPRGPRRSPARY